MLASRFHFATVALLVVALGLGIIRELHLRRGLKADLARQGVEADARFAVLRKQFADRAEHVATLDGQLAASRPALQPIAGDTDALTRLLQAADKAIESGQLAQALAELLRIHAEPYGYLGRQRAINRIRILAKAPYAYPAALDALHRLREGARDAFAATPEAPDLPREIGLLNLAVGEDSLTAALYDSLPPDDPRRSGLRPYLLPAYIQSQRYADALIERPFASMLRVIDNPGRSDPDPEARRDSLIRETAVGIEILVGTGKTDEATMLTNKLLAFDGSDSTRELIRQHGERARQAQAP